MISHAQAVATRDARPLQTPVEGLNLPLGASLGLAEALAQALDARDRYTAGHSLRVAEYAHAIARELQLVERDVEIIRLAALAARRGQDRHPGRCFAEAGPIDSGRVRTGEAPSANRAQNSGAGAGFRALLDAVELHHENFDGAGYPYALAGEKIPLDARVIRVADAFDAMTTDRAYRPALTAESALKIVENGSGREFDPRCAAAMSKIMRLRGRRELVHPAASDLFATSRPAPAKLIA